MVLVARFTIDLSTATATLDEVGGKTCQEDIIGSAMRTFPAYDWRMVGKLIVL